jgi:hypothetical protein
LLGIRNCPIGVAAVTPSWRNLRSQAEYDNESRRRNQLMLHEDASALANEADAQAVRNSYRIIWA